MSEAILRTKITGDSVEFQRSMREGIESAREFGEKVGDAIKETVIQVAALTIGVETVKEALERGFEGVKDVFELSKELRNLSNQTGASTKDLLTMQTEFKLSGLEASNVGQTINRMQRNIENASDKGGQAANVFARLGLNLADIQRMNPASQFDLLRERIAGIEDPARRAQMAIQLFGREGASMLALFKNKDIGEEASNALGEQARILDTNSKTFEQVATLMETAGIKLEGFFVGMAAPIGNVILPVLKALTSLDLTKWGSSIGNAIADAVRVLYNAFEEGKLGQVVSLALRVGFEEAVGWLIGALPAFGQAVYDIFGSDFAARLSSIFDGVALQFGAALTNAISDPLLEVQAALSFQSDKAQAAADAMQHRKNAQSDDNRSAMALDAAGREALFLNTQKGLTPEEKDFAKQSFDKAIRDSEMYRKDAAQQRMAADASDTQSNESFADYSSQYKKNNKATLFGASADDMSATGKKMIQDALDGMGDAIKALTEKIKKDFTDISPSGLAQTEADKKELTDLLASLNKSIAGEGKPNEPEPGMGQGGDFAGGLSSKIEGTYTDDQGGQHFVSMVKDGAIDFGTTIKNSAMDFGSIVKESANIFMQTIAGGQWGRSDPTQLNSDSGSAARAGRTSEKSESSTNTEAHLSEINTNIKDIKSAISSGLELA